MLACNVGATVLAAAPKRASTDGLSLGETHAVVVMGIASLNTILRKAMLAHPRITPISPAIADAQATASLCSGPNAAQTKKPLPHEEERLFHQRLSAPAQAALP
ncbi:MULTISPECIES: hypothetical protein [unclassified Pseudomonas]|uniref:hypothetical protein n=1 Tax=unclassified Pseudomonas TaxID=196821 RepID=UPI001146EF85|nr:MULTISPECIES: hypothetical protein [unclassified Pseudomonas]QOF83066.1 hypothetical protein IG194_21140 [Pseudomonas sp. ADPe]